MKPDEIKALREKLDITQVQLAGLMGVHPVTVTRWECGQVTPTAFQAEILSLMRERRHPKRFRVAAELMKYGPARVLARLL